MSQVNPCVNEPLAPLTVTATEAVCTLVGVPAISPVPRSILKPSGRPVALKARVSPSALATTTW